MYKLYAHQQQLADFALSRPYALWYAGVGVGKTGAAIHYLSHFAGLRVVLTPKSGLHVYTEDWQAFGYGYSSTTKIVTLDKGTSAHKQSIVDDLAATKQDVIIVVNYATARLMRWSHIKITAAVADEAQKLGANNSKTSLVLAREFAHVERKVAMSGTPYADSLVSLFGIVRWLDPIVYDNSRKYPGSRVFGDWQMFMAVFCQTYMHNNVPIIAGTKNEERLAELIKPFTIQLRTEDVIDLPDAVDTVHPVAMSGKWRKAYADMAQDAAVEVDGQLAFAPHILARLIALQLIACSGVLITDDNTTIEFDISARVAALKDLLETLGSVPIVIFTRFKRDVKLIQTLIDEDVSLLTGDIDTHQEWREGKTRVLIANISAGNAAVRLERAQHMIFWSVGWSNNDYEQARGRIRRNGQQAKHVFFHHIITADSVDEDIYHALAIKQKTRHDMDKRLET